jgi:hypothetical protein
MVTLCEFTPESAGRHSGRGPRLWAFGYATLAKLFGMTEGAVRQAVCDGRLDPSDLEMVCESWMRHNPSRAQQFVCDLNEQVMGAMADAKLTAQIRASIPPAAPLDPEEEVALLKQRCKEMPITRAGPTPSEMVDRTAKLDPGDINARCAAGAHQPSLEEVRCGLCGQLVGAHTPDDLAVCMAKLKRRGGPNGPGKEEPPDPDVPF